MSLPKPTQGEPLSDGGLTETQFWLGIGVPWIAFTIFVIWKVVL